MQLGAALRAAAERLSGGPHADRARRDAEMLLRHITGLARAGLLAHGDDELDDAQAATYRALIERRFAGEPIQYITGTAEFFGLPLRVTREALIPRPETEHLVECALERARGFPALRIADVGTGSGAIAIALAHALSQAAVTAIDISPTALDLARDNVAHNNAAVRLLEGDLLAPVAGECFDLIVSNPPYVPAADRAALAVEVREYEPPLALFAGPDGLAVYRRLIPAAFSALVPGGSLLLEIGFGQSGPVSRLLSQAGFTGIALTPDLQGIPRVAEGRRP